MLTGGVGGARLWDVESGKEIRHFESVFGMTYAIAFSPDGKQFMAGRFGNTAELFDIASGKLIRRYEAPNVNSIAFTPDGAQILTGSGDHVVRPVGRNQHQSNPAVQWLQRLGQRDRAFSRRQADLDRRYRRRGAFRSRHGQGNSARFEGLTSNTRAVGFAPSGKQVLTIGWDASVRFWDAASGKEIRRFESQAIGAQTVAFSPDGKWLVIGSRDCTTRIWNVATGEELCALVGMPNGDWAVVDSAGRFDASNGGDVEGLHWVVGYEPVELSSTQRSLLRPGPTGQEARREPGAAKEGRIVSGSQIVSSRGSRCSAAATKPFRYPSDESGGRHRPCRREDQRQGAYGRRAWSPARSQGDRAHDSRRSGRRPTAQAGAKECRRGASVQRRGISVQPRNCIRLRRSARGDCRGEAESVGAGDWRVALSRVARSICAIRPRTPEIFPPRCKIAGTRLFDADRVHLTLLASAETDPAAKATRRPIAG